MNSNKLKIKLHYPDMPQPGKAHNSDSGIDLTVMEVIKKRENVFFFDMGISIEPPSGHYAEVFPRSSIYKQDFIMANSVGIIDEDYRGIIFMPMRYVGSGNGLDVAKSLIGTRVGQMIIKKRAEINFEIVSVVSETTRGDKGFGSSGVS